MHDLLKNLPDYKNFPCSNATTLQGFLGESSHFSITTSTRIWKKLILKMKSWYFKLDTVWYVIQDLHFITNVEIASVDSFSRKVHSFWMTLYEVCSIVLSLYYDFDGTQGPTCQILTLLTGLFSFIVYCAWIVLWLDWFFIYLVQLLTSSLQL